MSDLSVTTLTLDRFDHLSPHSRRCVYWEVDPKTSPYDQIADPAFEKEAWLSSVMLKWGSCAQIALAAKKPIGCAVYSPPTDVPRAATFPTAPVSPDAVLLTTIEVVSPAETGHRGLRSLISELPITDQQQSDLIADRQIAAALVQAVVRDLIRRGVRALEAFGYRPEADLDIPSQSMKSKVSQQVSNECANHTCVIPADFLESVGFEVVAAHHRYPRLRLELDRDHEWKVDVERALEQLLAAAQLTGVGNR